MGIKRGSGGIYAVISYFVAERTQEIGIRVAPGALRRDILALVFRQGLAFVLLGAAAGLLASMGLMRLLAGMLYGITVADPATFAAVIALLAAIAGLAIYLPARRATKVDPMAALRYE